MAAALAVVVDVGGDGSVGTVAVVVDVGGGVSAGTVVSAAVSDAGTGAVSGGAVSDAVAATGAAVSAVGTTESCCGVAAWTRVRELPWRRRGLRLPRFMAARASSSYCDAGLGRGGGEASCRWSATTTTTRTNATTRPSAEAPSGAPIIAPTPAACRQQQRHTRSSATWQAGVTEARSKLMTSGFERRRYGRRTRRCRASRRGAARGQRSAGRRMRTAKMAMGGLAWEQMLERLRCTTLIGRLLWMI